ncbi:MAG: tRNA-guanine transglycosylase [Anaerolineae bacterium]|nr:tRNA-guanine transglycosylase [Anaerolineae bacterium]
MITSNGETCLDLIHGRLPLPTFLPDATRGVVRSVDSVDLCNVGIKGVMMNTFHLMQSPGTTTVKALGGLHNMAGWDVPIFTDSGGFQIYSLIHENPKYGSISNKGLIFRPENRKEKIQLSPEKSIQLQLKYGADVIFCLDDCTHVDHALEMQKESVKRTIDWAKRSKIEFERAMSCMEFPDNRRPLLFAVIQGGGNFSFREWCAKALLEIGFDGFGFGGWPLDSENNLLLDIVTYTRDLVPYTFPMHGLGIGHPGNILASFRAGYTIFDSAMPTRDARHGRLYVFNEDPATSKLRNDWFSYLYIQDDKHIKSSRPVSPLCDCLCCQKYSLGYLQHLFKIRDCLYQRLATMHNLRFMTQLMASLKKASSPQRH